MFFENLCLWAFLSVNEDVGTTFKKDLENCIAYMKHPFRRWKLEFIRSSWDSLLIGFVMGALVMALVMALAIQTGTTWNSLLITSVTGALGIFVGSLIERKTKHQLWLSERRAEFFAEFLKILQKCEEKASIYLRENPEEKPRKSHQLYEIYYPARDYAKIVRLFLREDLRDHFEKLVRKIGGSYSLDIKERAGKMVEVKEEIQKILEEHIKNPKW